MKRRKMSTESNLTQQDQEKPVRVHQHGGSDAVYGIGLFGAWVYFIGRATTPQERLQGFLKGLVWPAFLVYKLFVFLENK